ncbi:MAG: gamma-glutamyl-gamma-aminobutyrate hydrolase family protein [Pirellulales bacterium]|nr:gamma-glutamyl-gamma-aminobutyrate hydrolase family protein [Pirellulales bacterium]
MYATMTSSLSGIARQRAFCGALALIVWQIALPTFAETAPPAAKKAEDAAAAAGNLFAGYAKFTDRSPASVALLDTHDLAELQKRPNAQNERPKILQLKNRLEELSGLPCLLVHSTQINRRALNRPNVTAIVLAAAEPPPDGTQAREIAALVRETEKPLLIIGRGSRELMRAYSGAGDRPAKGQPDMQGAAVQTAPKPDGERDFAKARIVKRDPLFAGLPDELFVPSLRSVSATPLPPELESLAGAPEKGASIVKHKDRPVYGAQFHPELYDYVRTDGRTLLANFFRIAGIDLDRTVPAYLAALRARAASKMSGLHDSPEKLRTQKTPLVCGIDMENPDTIVAKMKKPAGQRHGDKLVRFRARMKEISGLPCLVVHFSQVAKSDFDNPAVRAVLIMGQGGDDIDALNAEIVALIRATEIPILGLCRGHQLIAESYGSSVEPMRPLKPGEKDPDPEYHPGHFKESGFLPVGVIEDDPLFAGFGKRPVFRESHYAEVKQMPPGFVRLAGNPDCLIESIKHERRPIYGVQFHPENYDDEHPDGKALLANFFRLADIAPPARSGK